jgi:hypothetical protein
MTTYKVYVDGFCFEVDLTDGERDALQADGVTVEELRKDV